MKFEPMVVGLYTGLLLAAWHTVWSLLVFFGWASVLLNFAFGLHFLSNPYVVKPFSLANALMLIIFVFVVWFILGYVATLAWNKMQKGK